MKGKTKQQKGITLIALIITIVVLLILAAVAISSIQNDGILHYAQNASDNWNKAGQNEANMLGDYLDYLNNVGSGEDDVPTVTPMVGQYVEYDVSYTDMYTSSKTFGKTDGWRYLGKDGENHLLISTGIPMILNYNSTADANSAQWWDTTQTNSNAKMAEGLKKNLANIPYAKVSAGTTSTSITNTMIGLFGDNNRTTVGDYFKVTGKTYSNNIAVRTLTLEELKTAVSSALGFIVNEDYLKQIPEGTAFGLFELLDLNYEYYDYWLASPYVNETDFACYVAIDDNSVLAGNNQNVGFRPVVVLPSDIQFTDADTNGVLEIKE